MKTYLCSLGVIGLLLAVSVSADFFTAYFPYNLRPCEVFSITWTNGTAPFTAVIAPINGQPFVYTIPDSAFDGTNGQYQLQLQLNEGQAYTYFMYDASGVGSSGQQEVMIVPAPLDSTSCLATASENQTTQDFFFTVGGNTDICAANFELAWSGGPQYQYTLTWIPLDFTYVLASLNLTTQGYANVRPPAYPAGTRFTIVMSSNQGGFGNGGVAGIYAIEEGDGSCTTAPIRPTGTWPAGLATETLAVSPASPTPTSSSSYSPSSSPISSSAYVSSGGSSSASSAAAASSSAATTSSGLSSGAIAGIAVGCTLGGIAVAILIGICFWRRRKNHQRQGPVTQLDMNDDSDMVEPFPGNVTQATWTTPTAVADGSVLASDSRPLLSQQMSSTTSGGYEERSLSPNQSDRSGPSFRSQPQMVSRYSAPTSMFTATSSPPSSPPISQRIGSSYSNETSKHHSQQMHLVADPPGSETFSDEVSSSGQDSDAHFLRHSDAGQIQQSTNNERKNDFIELPPLYSDVPAGQ